MRESVLFNCQTVRVLLSSLVTSCSTFMRNKGISAFTANYIHTEFRGDNVFENNKGICMEVSGRWVVSTGNGGSCILGCVLQWRHARANPTCSAHSWLVHTPGWYTLLVGTHSWLVHTPGCYTLLVGTHSWLVHTPG